MAIKKKGGSTGALMRDKVRQKAKEAEFSGASDTVRIPDGVSFFKPKKGKQDIIIVPFTMTGKNMDDIEPGQLWFRLPIKKHFKVGPEDKAVICPTTINKRCPICDYRKELLERGKDKDDPQIKELRYRKRELFNVIDCSDSDESIKVWEVSYHNFGQMLEGEIRDADDDSIAASFAEPVGGAILTIRMKESNMGTNKFLECDRIDFNERDDDLDEDILEQAVAFDKALVVLSYDEIKALLFELDDPENDEDNEPKKPARGNRFAKKDESEDAGEDEGDDEPRKPAKKPSRKPEPESEDEGDDEAPAKPPKRPARKPEPEDDDDEAPRKPPRRKPTDDEDDEPRKPAKKPSRRPEPEDEGDDEPRKPAKKPAKKPDPEEGECPCGGTFGEDCDAAEMDGQCENCDYWAECRDLADEIEKAKNAKKKR